MNFISAVHYMRLGYKLTRQNSKKMLGYFIIKQEEFVFCGNYDMNYLLPNFSYEDVLADDWIIVSGYLI